jgi:hypothetical protein
MKPFMLSMFSILGIFFFPQMMMADDGDSLSCYPRSSLSYAMISPNEGEKLTFGNERIHVRQKQNEVAEVPDGAILGDVNKDKDVDISDVVFLVNYILSGESAIGAIDMLSADINRDSAIDISDVVGLVNMILAGIRIYLFCPDEHHPHLIDLGLPSGTMWSCCNVGADCPESSGGFYAWGETEEKDKYNWSTYIHCDGSMDTCHDLGGDIAGTKYDVAHVQMGGLWRMPSYEQLSELLENCTNEWTKVNGVYGCKFTGTNGGSIFLPAAGYRWWSGFVDVGSCGYCWSSTPYSSYPFFAYSLYFSSGGAGTSDFRYQGRTVRPVIKF